MKPTRGWLTKSLTAAMLACFAVGGWFAAQSALKSNGLAYCSPVAPPTGPAAAEPQYLTKNIEDVEKGDFVLARDEHGREIGYRRVVEVYRRTSFHLRHLKFRDQRGHFQDLATTDEHPFLDAESDKFVNAGDLPLFAKVTAPDGQLQTLVLSKREEHPEGVPVFNFQVEGFHTYYVHQPGASVPVLVHNANAQFYSPDKHVADIANDIEARYPGHVVGVNIPIRDAAGKVIGEHDILLKNASIQVKSGGGKGLAKQMNDTAANTGILTIGYGPHLKRSVVENIGSQGGLVTRDLNLLLDVVAP